MNGIESWVSFLADVAIKGAIVLGIAEGVISLSARSSSATRHLMRWLAMLALLLLPVARIWGPAAGKPIWAVGAERISGNQIALTLKLRSADVASTATPKVSPSGSTPSAKPEHLASRITLRNWWANAAFSLWAMGVAAALLPLGIGLMERRRLARGSRPFASDEWEKLLSASLSSVGVREGVTLLQTNERIIPVTWGWLRPVILLPACAGDWSEERKRLTVMHELAHVQRRDCFMQVVTQIACALHWYNPLVWRGARAMRLDREQACDDLVLAVEGKASNYAQHLFDIASSLKALRLSAGIPMARRSQLEQRISALLATARSRRVPGRWARASWAVAGLVMVTAIAAQKTDHPSQQNPLREQQLATLKQFSARKEHQAETLVQQNHEEFFPEFRTFFAAAKSGDWQTVTNNYVDFRQRHSQYDHATGDLPHTPYWQTVLEVCLAYADVVWGEPEHVQLAVDGFFQSIPAGSIYFGGTDPGRGFPTAFSHDHAGADPFFTLTQNALADATYLGYLRSMYGDKLYIPTDDDSQNSFAEYVKDATARLKGGHLKPGENVTVNPDGQTSVGGQVAVMEINARLARMIFEKNANHEFYIEESFPLDWMYPYLSPHGLIMRINPQPRAELPVDTLRADTAYWHTLVQRFVGLIPDDLSMQDFTSAVTRLYLKHELPRRADPKFFTNDWAQRAFSKWRSGIAGIYVWRAHAAKDPAERARMTTAAEQALRQAYLLCPRSPEAIRRYSEFLSANNRPNDALTLTELSSSLTQTP